ncbi:MAG TPA: hypothetical protein VJ385_03230 [Fibrobacteria bacterium]|nr:hypothetical protein [Fibrobacteria bacterium]
MNLQYLNWKIYLDNPAEAGPDEWFKVFNAWIPDAPEIFIDVADYKHVQDGPVTLLVGHYVNYSLDATGRRLGLLYDYKHPVEGANEDKLRSSLQGVLRVAKRLEEDAGFSHKPRFNAGELRFIVNSRAVAPNTPATLEAVKPDLVKVLAKAYGEGGFSLEHLTDPRQRFSVQVTAKGTQNLAEVLKRLG